MTMAVETTEAAADPVHVAEVGVPHQGTAAVEVAAAGMGRPHPPAVDARTVTTAVLKTTEAAAAPVREAEVGMSRRGTAVVGIVAVVIPVAGTHYAKAADCRTAIAEDGTTVAARARVAGVGVVFLTTVTLLGPGTVTPVVVIVRADRDVADIAAVAVPFVSYGQRRDVPAAGDVVSAGHHVREPGIAYRYFDEPLRSRVR